MGRIFMRLSGSGTKVLQCMTGLLLVCAAGCSDRVQERATAEPSERLLRIYNWEEYIDPSVLTGFSARTGIRIEYHEFATQDELTGSLRSDPSRYDLVVVDESVIQSLKDLKLLRPFDTARITGLSRIDPVHLQGADPGNPRYAVPYLWGTTLLVYRKDKIEEEPRSWAALWDPRYAGRIMMLPDAQEMFGIAALLLGLPMNTRELPHLEAIRGKLVEQAPLVSDYADALSIQDALLSGECWVACMYSGDAAKAGHEDDRIGYVVPDEGAPLWIDCFAIPRDAEHVEEAHEFVDYMLEPAVAARNANYLQYATPNTAALPMVAGELRADTAIFPSADVLARCGFFIKPDAALQRCHNETRMEIRRLRGHSATATKQDQATGS